MVMVTKPPTVRLLLQFDPALKCSNKMAVGEVLEVVVPKVIWLHNPVADTPENDTELSTVLVEVPDAKIVKSPLEVVRCNNL